MPGVLLVCAPRSAEGIVPTCASMSLYVVQRSSVLQADLQHQELQELQDSTTSTVEDY